MIGRLIIVTLLAFVSGMAPRVGEGIVVGSFQLNSTTGSQAVTGLGGQPKAVIYFTTLQDTTDAVTDFAHTTFGWTDCTNQAVRGAQGADGGLSNLQGTQTQSDALIWRRWTTALAVVGEATFTSCDSDGFTWNITVTEGTVIRIGYIAFMGSGIQAQAGTFTKPNGTGSQSTSGVGFTPTLVFFICGAEGQSGTDVTVAGATISFGAANGSQQWTNAFSASGTANGAGGFTRTDNVVGCLDTTPALDDLASRTTLDLAGWTLNWTAVDTTVEEPMFYLALRGVSSFLGTDNQRTSNGTTALSGFGFQPMALLATSRNHVSGTTVTTEGRFSFSVADGTNQAGSWMGSDHGCGINCAEARAFFTSDFMRMYTPAQTGSSSTLNSAMDLQALDSDGSTVDWTTTDGTAREYVYAGLRVAPAGGIGNPPFMYQNPLWFCCRPGVMR